MGLVFARAKLKRVRGYIYIYLDQNNQVSKYLAKIVLQMLDLTSSHLPPRIVKPQTNDPALTSQVAFGWCVQPHSVSDSEMERDMHAKL